MTRAQMQYAKARLATCKAIPHEKRTPDVWAAIHELQILTASPAQMRSRLREASAQTTAQYMSR